MSAGESINVRNRNNRQRLTGTSYLQTTCQYGRETFDSWGKRRKRRAASVSSDSDGGSQMRLSREIIVLDYGDEQTSPYDFDKPARQGPGNGKY